MGRKSLATKRKIEILDAFERCVVQYGLEGTSLDQIADEAGMKRSIIRHYIGNRDELVDTLIERIVMNYRAKLDELDRQVQGIPASYYLTEVIDYLFRTEKDNSVQEQIITHVLITAKNRYPRAKQLLVELFNTMITSLANDLIDAFPAAGEARCKKVAYGIICLSMMNDSMMWLGLDPALNQSARICADDLLRTLESKDK